MNYLYIVIGACLLYLLYKHFNSSLPAVETFSQDQTVLATKIAQLFKQQKKPSFLAYLEALNNNKNTSDNLISKGVYNRLANNPNLTVNDVLKEL